MRYSQEWRDIVGRFGRWVDFDNDYKTMDPEFMESAWHVFKKIHEKGLVYKGSRIMPYSTQCSTVLSNFEAGSNYQDISDPSIFITFPMAEDPSVEFLAWTTTPWTLPSNLMIAVNPELKYVTIEVEATGKKYIVAESRMKDVVKKAKLKKVKVIDEKLGAELEGLAYTPLFEYFGHMREDGLFKVMAEDFVSAGDGTGIVHCAPGFGEDDFASINRRGLIDPGNPPCPVDDSGRLTDPVTDFAGLYFKDADKPILANLKESGRLLYQGSIVHSYPFCWRSNTPLMYRSVNCWFIKVTALKDQLIENNKKSNWVPSNI